MVCAVCEKFTDEWIAAVKTYGEGTTTLANSAGRVSIEEFNILKDRCASDIEEVRMRRELLAEHKKENSCSTDPACSPQR